MGFEVKEYYELLRLLEEHPEWKAQLRSVLFTDDFLRLPEIVRELAEAQKRTEGRVEELAQAQARTEARLEELAQAQARTEARLEELAQAQARTEARLEELAQAQARTEARLEELAQAQARTEATVKILVDRVAVLGGRSLEAEYRDKAGAYFGKILKKVKVTPVIALEDKLEGKITPDEYFALLELDLLVSGIPRSAALREEEVWMAVEVSIVVDKNDVQRAMERAAILKKAGLKTLAAVAGEEITAGAAEETQNKHVVLLQNGKIFHWEQAIQNL